MRRIQAEEQLDLKEMREEPWRDLGVSGRGHSLCKGPGAGLGLAFWRNRPVWLEQSGRAEEREEGREGRKRNKEGRAGVWGPGESLGFYPQGGGSPGGQWAEGDRDLGARMRPPGGH